MRCSTRGSSSPGRPRRADPFTQEPRTAPPRLRDVTVLRVGRERRATSERGMDALFRAHAAESLRLGYLLTGDRTLAEDLVQDAFVRVLGRFHDLRNRDAFW